MTAVTDNNILEHILSKLDKLDAIDRRTDAIDRRTARLVETSARRSLLRSHGETFVKEFTVGCISGLLQISLPRARYKKPGGYSAKEKDIKTFLANLHRSNWIVALLRSACGKSPDSSNFFVSCQEILQNNNDIEKHFAENGFDDTTKHRAKTILKFLRNYCEQSNSQSKAKLFFQKAQESFPIVLSILLSFISQKVSSFPLPKVFGYTELQLDMRGTTTKLSEKAFSVRTGELKSKDPSSARQQLYIFNSIKALAIYFLCPKAKHIFAVGTGNAAIPASHAASSNAASSNDPESFYVFDNLWPPGCPVESETLQLSLQIEEIVL